MQDLPDSDSRLPSPAETLFHEGTHLFMAGDVQAAETTFRHALQLAPELAEAHANLALLLDQTQRSDEAEASYRRALELAPRQFQTQLNFAVMLAGQKRFVEAEATYRRALAIEPASPAAWSNLGVLLARLHRETEAESSYRTALALDPDYRKAAFNLAYVLLRQGRFDEGWHCLEARDWYLRLEAHLQLPRWNGEPLAGRRLLIGFEAGYGDMIQFSRYAALIRARGVGRVGILCHPGLKSLFATLAGVDVVIAFDEEFDIANTWDCWVPPLSLPHIFATRLDTIPADLPYLAAAPEHVAHWAERIETGDGLRVGLVWKGNPRFENDADRSLGSLADLAPLMRLPGVRWFSLQKGAGEDECRRVVGESALPITDLAPGMTNFADTAAILTQIDLLISVDTAVAHLAGAIGKACWVLLPAYQTDWRWLTERSDSPWYPGAMRLFRQTTMGDWATVIGEVRAALAERLSSVSVHSCCN